MTKGGGKKWFFLTADYAFGHSLEKDAMAVVKANGGEVVGSVRHPFPGSDFSSFLLKAQSLGRADHRPGQRRRRHHQLDQAGGRVRHHAQADSWPAC